MISYFTSNGTLIAPGKKLGQGGEGAVFEIVEYPDLVIKIYHSSVSKQQEAKLRVMINFKTPELANISSWPQDTVHKTKGGEIVGFIMQKITGYKPVHELYSPKSRRSEFPHADWRFLINAATNISRAFAVVHNHNHVIGDVNHGNVVVARDGTVKLIDVDSFQVYDGKQYYNCEVGVAEYTPPELAAADFSKISRNQNHDAFGLAVLNFHLLFLGRHPFAGKYLGSGFMPIDKAIKENRFVYGSDAKLKLMESPPNTLSLNATSPTIAGLFTKAFNGNLMYDSRPLALDWLNGLHDLSKQLKQCVSLSSHYYPLHVTICPWCDLESKTGIDFFQPQRYNYTVNVFQLDIIWSRIEGIKRPPFEELDEKQRVHLPSQSAKNANNSNRDTMILYVVLAVISIIIGISTNLPGIIAILIFSGRYVIPRLVPNEKKMAAKFQLELKEVEKNCHNVLAIINMPLREFDIEVSELKSMKAEYQNLSMDRAKGFEHLKQNIRQNQLEKYLEKFEIKTAALKNIGEGRKQMLQSFGIESAADVSVKQVSAVPGFGPVFIKLLMDWRKECEKDFKFDYNKGIDPLDISRLDKKINDRRQFIEKRLSQGAQKLSMFVSDFNMAKLNKAEELEVSRAKYHQLKFDIEYLR